MAIWYLAQDRVQVLLGKAAPELLMLVTRFLGPVPAPDQLDKVMPMLQRRRWVQAQTLAMLSAELVRVQVLRDRVARAKVVRGVQVLLGVMLPVV